MSTPSRLSSETSLVLCFSFLVGCGHALPKENEPACANPSDCEGIADGAASSNDAPSFDGGGTPTGTDAQIPTAPDARAGAPSPIKHVIVVVKENHTFDNYFGTFPGAEGSTSCLTAQGVVPAPHAPDSTPRDLCHTHACALGDLHGGAMDGWLAATGASQGGDNLFCAQYKESDIPNYWAYKRETSGWRTTSLPTR